MTHEHDTPVPPQHLAAGRSRHWFTLVLAACVLALVCLAAQAPRASAASSDDLTTARKTDACADSMVTDTDTSKFPRVRLQLQRCSDGSGSVPTVRLFENGQQVSSVTAHNGPIGSFTTDPKPVIVLAIDASESMASPKIDEAKAAALQLIDLAGKDDRIGLVVFGGSSWKLVAPTNDFDALRDKVGAVTLSHGTKLYDGLHDAAGWFPDDATQRTVVVLSDGADTGSKSTEAKVVALTKQRDVTIDAVGIAGAGFVPDSLRRLAEDSGGTFESVTDASQLDGVYQALGQQLLRSWWIEYHSSQDGDEPVKIEVTPSGQATSVASYVAPAVHVDGHTIKLGKQQVVKHGSPLVSLPGGRLGVLIVAAPMALLFGFLGFVIFHGRGRVTLESRIAPYVEAARPDARSLAADGRASGRERIAPLLKATEQLLTGSALFARFRFLLQQANLPLREVELLYLMAAGMVGGFFVGLLFTRSFLFALAFAAAGAFGPYGWVRFKALRRKKKFEGQLADVLGTVAASLKAGHSFNQSLTSVAKEAAAPTRDEVQRVMAEARLGLPIEEALEAMATRLDSEDFAFAVTAVNIQRTVGGSLSEILEMVADTVRNRQQFRKKVKALTSMGTMSAYVLLAMPVFIAVLLTLMNHSYMAPLWSTGPGHIMLAIGSFMMLLGYVSCMKIVRIKI